MVPKASVLEVLWLGLFEYAAREEDPERLREVVINVNRLLTVIEERLAQLEDKSRRPS